MKMRGYIHVSLVDVSHEGARSDSVYREETGFAQHLGIFRVESTCCGP